MKLLSPPPPFPHSISPTDSTLWTARHQTQIQHGVTHTDCHTHTDGAQITREDDAAAEPWPGGSAEEGTGGTPEPSELSGPQRVGAYRSFLGPA